MYSPLVLDWDRLHPLSREQICDWGCVHRNEAQKPWECLEPWLQGILNDTLIHLSRGKVSLGKEE